MAQEFKTIEDMTEDLRGFVREQYNDVLPPRTSHADINVLWTVADRMQMFKLMAEQNENQNANSDFLWAVYHDYEMIFYGILYSTSVNSDELAKKDAVIGELRARLGHDEQARIDELINYAI